MTPRAPAMTAEARRASIIDATLPLLRGKGRAVSTKEIATAAGIAEGTIFRVFANKEELIHACVHQAFETGPLRKQLQAISLDRPLADRLAAAVDVMQDHLRGVFSLMMTLHTTGQPVERPPVGDRRHLDRQRSMEEIDQDFEELIAPDRELLRVPPATVVSYLRMLTLASVHPFLDGRVTSADELVDIVLTGALVRPDASRGER